MMPYPRLVNLTLITTLILIVVGAATRVYDAGMACPDWPACYGLWFPYPEARVVAAGHPAGYMVAGQHYTWWQVALEWGHRALAAVVGFLLLGLIGFVFRQPRHHWKVLALPLATAAVLLAVQIKLGAITVWFSNIHWSVAIHLGNAMLFLGALVWLRRVAALLHARGQTGRVPLQIAAIIPALAWGFVALVWATMLAGAMVSSSHAGGVCGGLPLCAGVALPADWHQLLHMKHRYLGVAVLLASVALIIFTKRLAPALKPTAVKIHLMVLGQVVLGILTLYSFSSYPAWYYPLSIAHLAWGTLLFIGALGLVLNVHYGLNGRVHGRG